MKEKISYTPDAKGQLELDGIDTPLGEAAEAHVEAITKLRKAQTEVNDCMIELIDQMKASGIRTLRYKGDTLRYQPGHSTPDKIKFVPSQD